jgi:3-dehydroshikimate dehydratase
MTIVAGLCSITMRQLAGGEIIALAAQAGLEGIEWSGDAHLPIGDLATAESLRRQCEDAGIAVSSYGSYLGIDASEAQIVPDQVQPALDTAEALGAPLIRIWTPLGVEPQSPVRDRELVYARTAAIVDAASRRGLEVALEFHPGTLTHTAAAANDLLDRVSRPDLRTHWQPDPALSARDALDELRFVLPHLAYLHVFTWGPNGIADRLPLAEGADLWTEALALAATSHLPSGRPCCALLEFVHDDSPEQLIADAATLRRWIAAVS